MEKRTLLALALSLVVLGFYPMILQHFYPDYYKSAPKTPAPAAQPDSKPLPSKTFASASSAALSTPLLSEQDVPFVNEYLELKFNPIGGGIREIRFPQFVDSSTHEPLKFLSPTDASGSPTAIIPSANYVLSPGKNRVVAQGILADQVRVTKSYEFSASGYSAVLKVLFENTSDAPKEFHYKLAVGESILPRHSIDGQYIEANFYSEVSGKKELRHLKETKAGKVAESQGSLLWAATKDRHFSVIVRPESPGLSYRGLVEGLGNQRFLVSLLSERTTLAPRGSLQQDFLVYIGPNDVDELLPLGLDPIVNFGKLDAIGKLLVGGLEVLNKVFRNYGLAIIALTILINIVLFPLTRASYMSMKRMQLVQPQMTKLRDQHKKNPEKLNKEMMELYKKHKVNPFGGCLPMLLQMPVFMALYVALSKSVILIDSKLLWIHDLSSPDSVSIPFTLPIVGKEIHVLPLIMVAAMVVQQKFTQIKMEGQDPAMEAQQKMMAVMMPLMFGFIFYTMPSGLVLYWLTNTVLMSLYQLRLKRMTLA